MEDDLCVPPGAPVRDILRVVDIFCNGFDKLGAFVKRLARLEVFHLDTTNINGTCSLAALKHGSPISTIMLCGTLLDDALLAKLGNDGNA